MIGISIPIYLSKTATNLAVTTISSIPIIYEAAGDNYAFRPPPWEAPTLIVIISKSSFSKRLVIGFRLIVIEKIELPPADAKIQCRKEIF